MPPKCWIYHDCSSFASLCKSAETLRGVSVGNNAVSHLQVWALESCFQACGCEGRVCMLSLYRAGLPENPRLAGIWKLPVAYYCVPMDWHPVPSVWDRMRNWKMDGCGSFCLHALRLFVMQIMQNAAVSSTHGRNLIRIEI